MAATLIQQLLIMFLLASVGYLMFRTKKISLEGSRTLGNILIYLSLPCVIINGFLLECTKERVIGLFLSSVLSLAVLLLSVLISRIIFKKNAIEVFGASFSNPGFFGIPLILAVLSDSAVFYAAPFIAFLNLFQWTYGVHLLTQDQQSKKSQPFSEQLSAFLKKLITAPFMAAILIGLFFFLSGIEIPALLRTCVSSIAGLNTPLAMFTIGIYLAQTDLLKMFLKPRIYLVTFVRMVLIPVAAFFFLCIVPDSWLELKMTILIASACPVGSNVAVYAQLHNHNYTYAVETVVLSTLFSLITIPVIVTLAAALW